MSDNRDADTGQFTASEPLFGQAYVEQQAGYKPMLKDEDDDELTIEQAEQIVSPEVAPDEPEELLGTEPLEDKLTLTLDQAAEILSDTDEARQAEQDEHEAEQIRQEVDKLRAEGQPEAKEEEATEPAFDPAKALEHPQVKEAIEKVTAETEAARQSHVSGLAAATMLAEASFFNQFPELANLEGEQRVAAFAAIAQNDPQRADQIRNSVGAIANLFQRYSDESGKISAENEAKQRDYAKAESDRFESMIKDTPKPERAEIEGHIVEAIKEYGGEVDQFVKLMKSSEFANATVQRLLWDVGKYRQIRNAPKVVAKAQLPPVQRPGHAGASSGPRNANIAALQSRFNQTSSFEDAWRLFEAQLKAG